MDLTSMRAAAGANTERRHHATTPARAPCAAPRESTYSMSAPGVMFSSSPAAMKRVRLVVTGTRDKTKLVAGRERDDEFKT